MPVLEYDAKRGLFHFSRPMGALPFPGAAVSADGMGRRFSFEDVSPKNYHNLKLFKSFYGDDAKATKEAVARIEEIKADRETNYVEKYADLISGSPYDHQLAVIDLMQKNDRYALLLEQGLGKTYIALQSFKMFKERDGFLRAVVVCPKVVFPTWIHEIEKFAPELRVLKYRGSVEERREIWTDTPEFDVMLTTYDMIRKEGSTDLAVRAHNGWAWSKLPFESRKKLVSVMDDRLGKHKELLLADYGAMSRKERAKWRTRVGPILAEAGEGYWSERSFAYMEYEGIRDERYAMQMLTCEEQEHDYVVDLINYRVKPNVVVFDEASRVVSHTSKQSHAAEAIRAKRRYLLSGTLCVGRPTDMYMPMKVLDPGILNMNWTAFRDKFCYTSRYNRAIITGYRNLDLLKSKVDPFIVEYRRDECLDLPDRTIVTCWYEPDPAVVELYDEIVSADDYVELDKDTTVFCSMQLQKIGKCMQLLSGFINTSNEYALCRYCSNDAVLACATSGIRPGGRGCSRQGDRELIAETGETREIVDAKHNAKLQMLKNDLEDILDREKAIVWYWFQYDFEAIKALLESMKVEYITAEEEDCAARFEANPDIRVFLGQVVQGIGITLNSATTTIYYSHGLALEPRLQSMDRNMRIGQSKPVVVRDYVCRGSVEEAVVALLQHKEDVRDFMQKRVECLCCERMVRCVEERIRRYGEGCMYHEQMKQAETKRTLKLRTIGELYGN